MTKVYGYSDDIVTYGDDEIDCYDDDVIIVFSDNTIIRVGYSKESLGVWWIEVVHAGTAAHRLEICTDEEAEIYSDVFEIDADVAAAFTTRQKYPLGKPA